MNNPKKKAKKKRNPSIHACMVREIREEYHDARIYWFSCWFSRCISFNFTCCRYIMYLMAWIIFIISFVSLFFGCVFVWLCSFGLWILPMTQQVSLSVSNKAISEVNMKPVLGSHHQQSKQHTIHPSYLLLSQSQHPYSSTSSIQQVHQKQVTRNDHRGNNDRFLTVFIIWSFFVFCFFTSIMYRRYRLTWQRDRIWRFFQFGNTAIPFNTKRET